MSQCLCLGKSLYLNNSKILSTFSNCPRRGGRTRKWMLRSSSCNSSHLISNFDRSSFNSCDIPGRKTSILPLNINGKCNYSNGQEFSYREQSDDKRNGIHGNDYTLRTHSCGELRSSDIGSEVRLYGWVSFNRMNKFILLRDSYGTTQVVIPKTKKDPALDLYLESVICVIGFVRARPPAQVVKNLETGEIEVHALSIDIISSAMANLPLHIREWPRPTSQVLNRYRYLALRFPKFQYTLRLRSEILFKMREFLIRNKNFVEVETPTLFKKTPGGAQEFIVPTHEKDKFYSLVQSPQQLKQLLMVGSMDRYFQIARCYRDEGTTVERQPEFTQLDVELSFTDMDGVMKLTEDVLVASWPKDKNTPKAPFPKMRYQDAIENYGSDKPCVLDRFLIQNITPYARKNDEENYIYMFTIPDGKSLAEKLTRNFELLVRGDSVRVHVIEGETTEKLCDHFSTIIDGFDSMRFLENVPIKSTDLVILAKGSEKLRTLETLGLCRHRAIDELGLIEQKNADGVYDFLWIVDFPLFEMKNNEIKSSHHPFTHPHPEDVALLSKDPMEMRSLAYDLVLNGSEIGGGSIRIHDAKLQTEILTVLGLPLKHFGHMLEALQVGCPPHGGIALGIDRLIAILCNRKSIKDVIAFPKGGDGQDLMTECPSDIPVEDKIRYHIPTS